MQKSHYYRWKLALIFVGLLFVQSNIHAQLLNKLKDRAIEKAEQKVEDRLVKEADKKMDQALDSLENKIFDDSDAQQNGLQGNPNASGGKDYNINININDNTNSEAGQNLNAMLGQLSQMTTAAYEKTYTFQQKIVLEITSTDQGDEEMNMTQFVGEDGTMIIVDSEEKSRIISDYKNNSMLIMNDKDFTGTAISMEFMEGAAQGFGVDMDAEYYDEEYMEAAELSCKETGNTKDVAGYTCKNWVCENDSGRFEAWYTDEVLFDFEDKKWGKIGNMFSMNYVMNKLREDASGTALEVVYFDKIENETATFKVVEIDRKAHHTFNTSAYTFPTPPKSEE